MKIDCPHCGVHGSVDDSLAGKKLRCPKCSKIFLIAEELPEADDSSILGREMVHDSEIDDQVTIPEEPGVAIADEQVAEEEPEEIGLFDEPQREEEPEEVELLDEPEEEPEEIELDEADLDILEVVEEAADTEEGDDDAFVIEEMEPAVCSECGQSFGLEFLEEIDSKLYCALCQPDSSSDEEELAFEEEDSESLVADDDFLSFSEDDDDYDEETTSADVELEVCSGCGESLHPQFLDTIGGKKYCALCLPEDNDENLELTGAEEQDDEGGGLEFAGDYEVEELPDSVQALMSDDVAASDEPDAGEGEKFNQEACAGCGDMYYREFMQEIDSKLYCGICQPEVVEIVDDSEDELFPGYDAGAAAVAEPEEELQGRDVAFTVGGILKEAWQKTKGAKASVWGGTIVMYCILFALGMVASYGSLALYEQGQSSMGAGINLGLQGLSAWLSMIFTGGLMLIGVRRAFGQRVSWKMVFAGFSGSKFLSMTIASVLQIILISIGFLLLVIPGIYLSVGYGLALPLILDRGLGPWEALETSRKAIHKKWWTVFGLYLVMVLLYVVSAIPAGIGLIWTIPMFFVLIGVLYVHLFGFSSEVEEDEEEMENTEEVVEEGSEESL